MVRQLQKEGKAIIALCDEEGPLGVLGLSDQLRPRVPSVVSRLSGLGMTSVLLTGDHREAALYMAKEAGISRVEEGFLPEDRAILSRWKLQGTVW